ncbi:unnamed protein product [Adineta ricciae]|uniref:Uncharacterized protein n=1 Tax=Adineta ricciae TaxID=249248 RepID=A0A814QL88_ADIRI|nr:unnamed protein product [Adineta ricciae]CAF1339008.1 unnamed protein product [Adineta ricciae]
MSFTTLLFFLLSLNSLDGAPQLNLYHTDYDSEKNSISNNCLRFIENADNPPFRSLSTFCLSELPSNLTIDNVNVSSTFTFAELYQQNVTSSQLYIWSTPIDIIERYQSYSDKLSLADNDQVLANEVFYNCTWPRFGPKCQYQLEFESSGYLSFTRLAQAFYEANKYIPTTLTCYVHLNCDRGPYPVCLDWTEICDGVLNCLNGDFDEENCWQLDLNKCNEDEFQCQNGHCIPKIFRADQVTHDFECSDGSDTRKPTNVNNLCGFIPMSFKCEDMVCKDNEYTSSCDEKRKYLLIQAMFVNQDSSVSNECLSAIKCFVHIYEDSNLTCNQVCDHRTCMDIIKNECPETVFLPTIPLLFTHIYIVYHKNFSEIFGTKNDLAFFMCYNALYHDVYHFSEKKIMIGNLTCSRRLSKLWFFYPKRTFVVYMDLSSIYKNLRKYHQIFLYNSTFCKQSNNRQCVPPIKGMYFHICNVNKSTLCCPRLDNGVLVSPGNEDPFGSVTFSQYEENMQILNYLKNNISFLTTCNGFTELLPITIFGKNHTDETDCEYWECNSIYTHCNDYWNCPNGADELHCNRSRLMNCPRNHHLCISMDDYKPMCLPIEKANDGVVHCFGGTDEQHLCRKDYEVEFPDNFYCMGTNASCVSSEKWCDGKINCLHGDDEQFCVVVSEEGESSDHCADIIVSSSQRNEIDEVLCPYLQSRRQLSLTYFSLVENKKPLVRSRRQSQLIPYLSEYQGRCHHGLEIHVWLNGNNSIPACLCPPNFYGNACQYQNQRLIFIARFRESSNSRQTPFVIVVSLIDNTYQRIVHSYEQINYLPVRDCQRKYRLYLLYSTRPKNQTRGYSIHVDIFERFSLTYRGSFLFPIKFPFLPVHYVPVVIDIPRSEANIDYCSKHACRHGQCVKYMNSEENFGFCKCDEGWTGSDCAIKYNCSCAQDSKCVGISAANRSICVCPLPKFGSRCLLTSTVCQSSPCENNGTCIPSNDYSELPSTFKCICSKGYSGDECRKQDRRILLSFDKGISLSRDVIIHFVSVGFYATHARASTYAITPVKEAPLKIYWSRSYHIAFIELHINQYYLVSVDKTFRSHIPTIKQIKPSDRCFHINELFNKTLRQLPYIHQIKYSHLHCQDHSLNLSCFYDDIHMCLCYKYNQKRLANCFEFQHNMTYDCSGTSECQNGARCFQDHPDCPMRSRCVCQLCYFGGLCQFGTSGLGLSLDAILGYHIQPNTPLTHQSIIFKFSLALSFICATIIFINSLLSILTFRCKIIQEVGCGIYLFASSIMTLFIMIAFTLKFLALILSQMNILSNKLFLLVQCHSADFLLRVLINAEQWFNACVAIERAVTSIKGPSFNKIKSRQIAKHMIFIVLIINIGTVVHDALFRELIEEENEDEKHTRVWCIAKYPRALQTFNSAMYIFHFFGPFIINLISTIILITQKTYQQAKVHAHRSFRILLIKQIREHKHLLTAPLLLVILAIPRVIISFITKCMQSANDSWVFLIGYFISLIPPMLTFAIFVLPSTFYKKQFKKVIFEYRKKLLRCFHV